MNRIAVCLPLAALLLSPAACLAETEYLPDRPGKWVLTDQNPDAEWFGERHYKFSTEERKAYRAAADRLAAYFGGRPGARAPAGVNLQARLRAAYSHYDHEASPVKPSELAKPQLLIKFCPLYKAAGGAKDFCDEAPYAEVTINSARAVWEPALSADNFDDPARDRLMELFYEPAVLLDLGGGVRLYDGYYENRLVAARPGRPFRVPVTAREFGARVKAYYAAAVKKGVVDKVVQDAVGAELARVPAAFLDKPVHTSGELDDRPLLGVCSPDEPGARALYVFNPAYFDPALPRTAAQLLTIAIPGNLDPSPEETETERVRLLEYLKSLKGQELLGLLDVK